MAQEYAFIAVMRTEAIEDAIDKWTGGNADKVWKRVEEVSDIASRCFIEEEGYRPAGLVALLEDMDEPYVVLEECEEYGEYPCIQHRSLDADERLGVHITACWSLSCDEM